MAGLDGRGAVGPANVHPTYTVARAACNLAGRLAAQPGPYACLPPGGPSAAIVAATSALGESRPRPPATTRLVRPRLFQRVELAAQQ